jgi:hypothetical protein
VKIEDGWYYLCIYLFIYLCGWNGTKSTTTAAIYWPIYQLCMIDGDHCGAVSGMNEWQGKRKYSEETCPSAAMSTKYLTWLDPGSNPGRSNGKPATDCLNEISLGSFQKLSGVEPSGSATSQLVRWILGKWAIRKGGGWNWLRIVSSGWLLYKRRWTCGFWYRRDSLFKNASCYHSSLI